MDRSGTFKQSWGPKVFTTPVSRIDLRVGSKYLSCMRGPDGRDYWSTGVYREIAAPERLVITDSFAVEDRDDMLKAGVEEGVFETMDRFAELLKKSGLEERPHEKNHRD